jgi:acetoin utilization protein AcuB
MTDGKLTVGDWMTPDPVTVEEDASVLEAIHLLEERSVRHLPVLRAGRLVGLATELGLLGFTPSRASSLDRRELLGLLSRTPVREAMDPCPHTVTPETPLADAARLLRDRKLGGVLVRSGRGDLVGVLTTTDTLAALVHLATQAARPEASGHHSE